MNAKSQLSKDIFTLPLGGDNYPFSLTAEEKCFSPDDWAWLFLRLNPLYQHDYRLWNDRNTNWTQVSGQFLKNGQVTRPLSLETVLNSELGKLDSRYFIVDGDPLGNESGYLRYEAVTLAEYLDRHRDAQLLQRLRVREFDAARDYGIGAWLDPKDKQLPTLQPAPMNSNVADKGVGTELPWRASWFFNVNEPIWRVNTWALAPAEPVFWQSGDNQTVQIGMSSVAKRVLGMTVFKTDGVDHMPMEMELHEGSPLPLMGKGLTATQFKFYVCLDGYVQPQVDMVFRIAAELLALHEEYYPKAVRRGAARIPVDIVSLAAHGTEHQDGIDSILGQAAVRMRKNWCAVTIDVAAALPDQKTEVVQRLKGDQEALGPALTFPIRARSRGETDVYENTLKRALCVLELHRHGLSEDGQGAGLSQLAMNKAIYCDDNAAYYELRGLPAPPRKVKGLNEESQDGHLDRVREALGLGKGMVLGWYEFVASRQFEDAVQTPKPRP